MVREGWVWKGKKTGVVERKVEQEGKEDEARKMEERREEKRKGGINGRERGRVGLWAPGRVR